MILESYWAGLTHLSDPVRQSLWGAKFSKRSTVWFLSATGNISWQSEPLYSTMYGRQGERVTCPVFTIVRGVFGFDQRIVWGVFSRSAHGICSTKRVFREPHLRRGTQPLRDIL